MVVVEDDALRTQLRHEEHTIDNMNIMVLTSPASPVATEAESVVLPPC